MTPSLGNPVPPTPVERLLADVSGHGRSTDGTVAVTLDGTGRLDDVQVSSAAVSNGRGAVERAVREAFAAAWAALTEARSARGEELQAAAVAQVGDLTAELRGMQDAASRQLAQTMASMQEIAARIAPSTDDGERRA